MNNSGGAIAILAGGGTGGGGGSSSCIDGTQGTDAVTYGGPVYMVHTMNWTDTMVAPPATAGHNGMAGQSPGASATAGTAGYPGVIIIRYY